MCLKKAIKSENNVASHNLLKPCSVLGSQDTANSRWCLSLCYLCSWISRWLLLPPSAGGNTISLSTVMHYLFYEASEKHRVGNFNSQVCHFVTRHCNFNYTLCFNCGRLYEMRLSVKHCHMLWECTSQWVNILEHLKLWSTWKQYCTINKLELPLVGHFKLFHQNDSITCKRNGLGLMDRVLIMHQCRIQILL